MQPNLDVLKEYKKQEKAYFERVADLDATTKARDAEKAKYDGLRKRRLDEFMTGFNLISLKLSGSSLKFTCRNHNRILVSKIVSQASLI